MKKITLLLLTVTLFLAGCTGKFDPSNIAPQYASSSSSAYIFTELTNYDKYTFRVFTWTVTPINGVVKEDAAKWLAQQFPGASVYNESNALIVIQERK